MQPFKNSKKYNMSNTLKLIKALKENSFLTAGKKVTAKDGTSYRYDLYILKYNTAAGWLVNLFELSAAENGKRNSTQFSVNGIYSFYFNRSIFKNGVNGEISFSELVEISN